MISKYIQFLTAVGEYFKCSESVSLGIAEVLAFLTVIAASILLTILARFLIKRYVYPFFAKTANKLDDSISESKLLLRISLIIPAIAAKQLVGSCFPNQPELLSAILKTVQIYDVIVITSIIEAAVNTFAVFYNRKENAVAKMKPITSLVQVVKIILYIICSLSVIAILLGKDLQTIIIGLGAISAVLILVFQNPILGFVGSIQMMVNDMLRIGDWIVMGQADGTVLEINLTTVKVQNWDNTITTIPTSTLITNQFTNWRNMSESGGRQIKRSINIDISTIKFCTPEMLEKYKQYSLVAPYIEEHEKDIMEYNESNKIDTSCILNGRQQTNLGIFRAYLREYLNHNPNLNHGMTMIVRQLQPTDTGLPLQIYVFSSKTDWASYENIQSDIFDHVIAAAPMFDLRIFQRSSSNKDKA